VPMTKTRVHGRVESSGAKPRVELTGLGASRDASLEPTDSVLACLESTSSDTKDGACTANVLVLGLVYPGSLGAPVTPIDPDDLRSQLLSLDATPDVPGEGTVSFNDDAVLVRSFDVLPTQTAEAGRCVIQARINDLLARIQIVEPPTGLVGIDEPPGGIEGLTLAGINEPPSAIVFTPNDTLKVALQSLPTGKDKEKNNTCAADVLVLGTVYATVNDAEPLHPDAGVQGHLHVVLPGRILNVRARLGAGIAMEGSDFLTIAAAVAVAQQLV